MLPPGVGLSNAASAALGSLGFGVAPLGVVPGVPLVGAVCDNPEAEPGTLPGPARALLACAICARVVAAPGGGALRKSTTAWTRTRVSRLPTLTVPVA